MTESQHNPAVTSVWISLARGTIGRCPKCGKGALLKSFSKPVDACAACAEPYGHIRADDGPAWLTILLVGHVMGALLLSIVPNTPLADWVYWAVFPTAAIAMILLIIPRAKGLFIALIWHTKCSGSERP